MDALDKIEFEAVPVECAIADFGRRLHPGHRAYAIAAVSAYLKTIAACEPLIPVKDYWVVQKENGRTWEHYAWGRRYESRDGRVREHRFMVQGVVDPGEDSTRKPAKIAIAALCAAFGQPAAWPRPWREPFQTDPSQPPDLVRIVEVGLANGAVRPLWSGSPEDARAFYDLHGRSCTAEIVAGGAKKSGASCGHCKLLSVCPDPVKAPGLLGLPAMSAPLRTVSATDLRYHAKCPAQMWLSALHLPRRDEYGPSAVRGQAIHVHLGALHKRSAIRPCSADELAVDGSGWSAGRWNVTGKQAGAGAMMLARHADVCPYDMPYGVAPVTAVRVEPQLAFFDTAANAIVLAAPDLLYREGESWIWREVKSTTTARWDSDDLLDEFPQLALAVLILHEGLLDGDPSGSRVEVETLRTGFADVAVIDPHDPGRIAKARDVITTMAAPWRADQYFAARPGAACTACPVTDWCPSRVASPLSENESSSEAVSVTE
jgi:hypothetical protein